MKKLCSMGMMVLLALVVVAGCGDGGSVTVAVNPAVVEIFSDPALDGDIKEDLPTGAIYAPTVATNTGSVLAGVNVSPVTGAFISESRGFLIFPLASLPSNASIHYASITVFVNNVSSATSYNPIPFLLDSIDTKLFPPPIVSGDFDSPFIKSRSLSLFGSDAGKFVEIDVTSLLADAQARFLPKFEVRLLFDHYRFLSDPTTEPGLVEMDDVATDTSRAPLLYVEYF